MDFSSRKIPALSLYCCFQQHYLKLKLNLETPKGKKNWTQAKNSQKVNENLFVNFVDDGKSGTENMSGSKPIFCNKESNVHDNILCFITDYLCLYY